MPQPDTDQRIQFRHSTSKMGACGHWLHLANLAAPLIIGELVKDSDKRWRLMRGSTLVIGLVGEALWASRIQKERNRECRER